MHAHHPIRGPLFMVIATGSYLVNDTFMKVVTEDLPPYQVLVMRGVFGFLWSVPLVLALGFGRHFPLVFDSRVVRRNVLEMFGILAYIVALANMPIGDVTALGQVTPLLVLVGASLLFGERIGPLRMALIGLGFAGALMVVQPSMQGVSVFALLALANAVLCAGRDLVGRHVAPGVPGMIVAVSAVVVVLAGAVVMHLIFEDWVPPEPRHILYMAASGFFLLFGHFFLFTAYRIGPTGAVAPFYYCFSVWAVISGLVVFGELPNALALGGIGMIVGSGLAIVLLDERRRRLTIVA